VILFNNFLNIFWATNLNDIIIDMKKILTLCMVIKGDKVLLGMKKRGFGVGRWNGFGGKVEEGEEIVEAAKRELMEEVGIETDVLEEVGLIDFEFENDPKILEVHIFKIDNFDGDFKESEEMRPEWFHRDLIPYEQMWSDDIYWLPMLLDGKKFRGRFLFDRPSDAEYSSKILEHHLEEL
jgi:8-oxo-dGTP diphosphatase/2-hydroxy-dATP diphosphatase